MMWLAIILLSVACIVLIKMYLDVGRKNKQCLLISFSINQIKIKGKIMAVTLQPSQFVEGTLQPVDRKGNPASVDDGTVSFTSSDESIFTVERDPSNELNVKVVAKSIGVAQLDYSADADLGEGVKTISGFTAIEVVPDLAVGFGISFGEPQDV